MSDLKGGTTIAGYTATHFGNILEQIKAVDGSGSGVDADTVDTLHFRNSSGLQWSADGTNWNVALGYTGSKGANGTTGYVGSQGITGYTGSKGTIGYTGSGVPLALGTVQPTTGYWFKVIG